MSKLHLISGFYNLHNDKEQQILTIYCRQQGHYFNIWFYSKITADGDHSHEIKRCLLLGRKAMANLDSILKIRDVTLPTKSV